MLHIQCYLYLHEQCFNNAEIIFMAYEQKKNQCHIDLVYDFLFLLFFVVLLSSRIFHYTNQENRFPFLSLDYR